VPVLKADPDAIDLDEAFKQAMQQPVKPLPPAPKEKDPEAAAEPPAPKQDTKARTVKADPKSRTARPKKEAQPVPEAQPASYYEEKLSELAGNVWFVLGTISPADAGALDTASPGMVKAWAKACEQDPKVRQFVDSTGKNSWVVGVAMSTVPLLMMVAANHGRLPERIMDKEKQAEQKLHLAETTKRKRDVMIAGMAQVQEEQELVHDVPAAA
jgi:hypothetical protein